MAYPILGKEENGWYDYVGDPVFFKNFPDDKRKKFCYVTSTVDTKGNQIEWENFDIGAPFIRKYRNYGAAEHMELKEIPLHAVHFQRDSLQFTDLQTYY